MSVSRLDSKWIKNAHAQEYDLKNYKLTKSFPQFTESYMHLEICLVLMQNYHD